MRVIFEMSEDEHRSVTVERHMVAGGPSPAPSQPPADSAGAAAGEAAAALDGGVPPAALLMAIGGEAEAGEQPADGVERKGGTSAGGPPDWLAEILSRRN